MKCHIPIAILRATSAAQRQHMKHLARLMIGAGASASLWACAAVSTPTPTVPPQFPLELGYWSETSPLIESAVLEGGTPLAEVYLTRFPGLLAGRTADWNAFVVAVGEALPVYEGVLKQWVKIQPPSIGPAAELHRAYGLAWWERVRSLTSISVGWKEGDESLLSDGLARWESASELGREAERLRVNFNTRITELCAVHRSPDCQVLPTLNRPGESGGSKP